ncbi:MAG: WecB/TagA/CpsF family glycosyltransferase [Acidobacteriota bacterium]|nr:WecB/TagA/CpsF family glycosyltransferase [Acidobacteriota bacterium]
MFRLVDFFAGACLTLLYLPIWTLHFLIARLSGRAWLTFDEYLGRGGQTLKLFRARALGLPFFDHPLVAESPRLWAVLRGKLSLVGPAPVSEAWADSAAPFQLERLRVRPGLVSTWYVRSRMNIAFEDEADLALQDATLSPGERFALLARAVPALLFGSPRQAAQADRVTLFGLEMANRTRDEAVAEVLGLAATGRRKRVAFVNPACVNIALKDSAYLKVLHQSDLIYPDGIGIQLACKFTGRRLRDNLNGTDLYPALAEKMAETGQSLFLLGARPGVAQAMAERARERWPALNICGVRHGYVQPEEEAEVVDQINATGADVLLVAMGVPQQELWIDRMLPRLEIGVVMGVGGLFDFYSGRMPRAPLWMREVGLEWLYRLIKEPRRMWRRYLVGNLVFLRHLVLGHKGELQ